MTSSGSGGGGGPSFSRWQIALALGATGAIGLGYWYLRQGSKEPSKKISLSRLKDSVSLDESEEASLAKETPLQRAQRHKNEGNGLFKKGKYDEAINCYNEAIEECPEGSTIDLATFYQNRAAAYEQLKKWSSVISDCTKALDQNRRYEKALYRRAKAYEVTKDWANCLDDVTAVCLIQSFQNQSALLMADRVLKELGKQHAAEAIKVRRAKLPSSQFIKTYFMSFPADPVYKKLMSTEEPLGEGSLAGFSRAKLAFATENFHDIVPACTEEISSSESESHFIVEALSLRASFYLLSGLHTEALEDFKIIVDAPTSDVRIKVNVLIKRASLHMQLEKGAECLEDFEMAAKLGPNVADVFHHRGQINLLMDKTDEARNDFERAVKLNPEFAIAFVQKCYADYRYAMVTSDWDMIAKVMNDFKRATQKFSTCSEVFVLYGQVLTERQQYTEAEELYLKATDIEPNNATILVHRGLLLLQWKSDIEKSVDLMRAAIRMDEKCEFAYETLGTIEVQRGNLVIAVEMFDKALELARTEMEMTHLFSLRDAAASQLRVTTKLGIGPQLIKYGA